MLILLVIKTGVVADTASGSNDSGSDWSLKRNEILNNARAGVPTYSISSSTGGWSVQGEQLKADLNLISEQKKWGSGDGNGGNENNE